MCPLLSHLWQVPAGALLIGLIRIVVLFCFRSFGRPCGVKEAENRYFLFKRCHIIFSRNESIVVPAAAVVSLNASLVVFFSALFTNISLRFTSLRLSTSSIPIFSFLASIRMTFLRSVVLLCWIPLFLFWFLLPVSAYYTTLWQGYKQQNAAACLLYALAGIFTKDSNALPVFRRSRIAYTTTHTLALTGFRVCRISASCIPFAQWLFTGALSKLWGTKGRAHSLNYTNTREAFHFPCHTHVYTIHFVVIVLNSTTKEKLPCIRNPAERTNERTFCKIKSFVEANTHASPLCPCPSLGVRMLFCFCCCGEKEEEKTTTQKNRTRNWKIGLVGIMPSACTGRQREYIHTHAYMYTDYNVC